MCRVQSVDCNNRFTSLRVFQSSASGGGRRGMELWIVSANLWICADKCTIMLQADIQLVSMIVKYSHLNWSKCVLYEFVWCGVVCDVINGCLFGKVLLRWVGLESLGTFETRVATWAFAWVRSGLGQFKVKKSCSNLHFVITLVYYFLLLDISVISTS